MSTKKTQRRRRRVRLPPAPLNPDRVRDFVKTVVGEDMHAARVLSLGNAVAGTMHAASLCIHAIGQGLAASRSRTRRHSVKQVDRLLSNAKLDVWDLLALWVPYVFGSRQEAVIALDWTEYAGDDQATIAAYLITTHGRATPLAWKTVPKSSLKDRRNEYEDEIIVRLSETIPAGVQVTLLADRGFGDQKLYEALMAMGWDFVIRFRDCIHVAHEGEAMPAAEWVAANGRAKKLKGARVTKDEFELPAVVLVKAPRMKEPWCLATTLAGLSSPTIIKLYGRRFTIEESFRDTKDIRFGLGLAATHIKDCARRDRVLLIAALAESLLKLLGAAGEALGYDRQLKTSTSPKRQLSLLRQGLIWYEFLPTMKEDQARSLLLEFEKLILQQPLFTGAFGLL